MSRNILYFLAQIDILKTMEKDELLTKKELLKYLKISNRTLYLLMKSHAFPYIKLGKRVLFRRSEIDTYLESKTIRK
jgi:excisionase family DNA binding protein